MTTYAYVGLPGSGKSYSVVENQIMPALKAGRRVVTNLPLLMDEVRQICPKAAVVEFPLDTVKAEPHRLFEFVKAGDLFVLDEAMKLWPSGEKVNKVPDAYKTLLAEHRHMVDASGNSLQIVVVVQDLGNLGAFAVRLIDNTFVHTKLTSVGAKGTFRIDVYQGPVKGPQYPINNRLRMMLGQYKPEVWKFYKSHTMSEAPVAGANEKAIDRRANILLRPVFFFGALACVGLSWAGWHFLNKSFVSFGVPPGASRDSATPRGSPASSSAPSLQAQPFQQSPPHREYRIVGWVVNEDSPARSKVALKGVGEPLLTYVEYAKCQTLDGELRCPVDGAWFTARGSWVAAPAPAEPVKSWKLGDKVALLEEGK